MSVVSFWVGSQYLRIDLGWTRTVDPWTIGPVTVTPDPTSFGKDHRQNHNRSEYLLLRVQKQIVFSSFFYTFEIVRGYPMFCVSFFSSSFFLSVLRNRQTVPLTHTTSGDTLPRRVVVEVTGARHKIVRLVSHVSSDVNTVNHMFLDPYDYTLRVKDNHFCWTSSSFIPWLTMGNRSMTRVGTVKGQHTFSSVTHVTPTSRGLILSRRETRRVVVVGSSLPTNTSSSLVHPFCLLSFLVN